MAYNNTNNNNNTQLITNDENNEYIYALKIEYFGTYKRYNLVVS